MDAKADGFPNLKEAVRFKKMRRVRASRRIFYITRYF